MTSSYWSIVKANVTSEGADREDALNEWWNHHAAEYVARDGFSRGWRMRSTEHDGAIGSPPHRYHAVYEVDEIATFNAALEHGTESHPGRPWGPWQEYVDEYVMDWERTYYRVLHRHEADANPGHYWACVKANLRLEGPGQEREFDDWYSNKHMPEICSHTGVHRGWRLRVQPDPGDLGDRRQTYWGTYEVDSPDDFARARQDRADRGIEPWDGIWLPYVEGFEIHFYELLLAVGDEEAGALGTSG